MDAIRTLPSSLTKSNTPTPTCAWLVHECWRRFKLSESGRPIGLVFLAIIRCFGWQPIWRHSRLGAVAVPFATALTPDSVGAMQAFVNCKVLLAERRVQRRFAAAFPADLPTIFDDVLQGGGAAIWPAPTAIDVQQDAALMFTSGTTARPRAVRITHRNIQANTASIIEYLDLIPADRTMAVLQFYYCFGTSLLHTHLRAGGSLVLSNNFVYPETVLDLMEATQCTGFAGVPSTYQTLLRNATFPKRKIKSLRKVQQAGGKLQPVLIEELDRRRAGR